MENVSQHRPLRKSLSSSNLDQFSTEELRLSSSHSRSSQSDLWILSHREELERKEKAAATILRIADQRAMDQKAMDQEAMDQKAGNKSVRSVQYFLNKVLDSTRDAMNHVSALVESVDLRPDAFYYSGMSLDKARLYARRAGFGSNQEYSEDALREVNKASLLYLIAKHTVDEAVKYAISEAETFLSKRTGGERRKLTIGISGGMGPGACVTLQQQIIDATVASRDQDHIHVIANNYPRVPDRTAFILDPSKEDPTPTLKDMAVTLQKAGADLLVASCNTASKFARDVAPEVRVPLLDWPAEVAASVAVDMPKLKRLGLFATTGTVTTRIYHEAFEPHGITIIVPEPSVQENQVMGSIYSKSWGIKSDKTDPSKVLEAMSKADKHLKDNDAQAVLFACTEFSQFFNSRPYQGSLRSFDASQAIAKRLVLLSGTNC